ncbi:hypothetical protein [Rhodobacter maris]|uniref:Uncharacterized protein n=1 Tax=Rhodobacter maris TaxID=446682 RepID=A0A285RJ76_9RHOB|nr:hypothetical protein [Rhodobacter maris]SOB94151.1 hypothetical protein SAMN05877831_101339 [Rhodobacter maris]
MTAIAPVNRIASRGHAARTAVSATSEAVATRQNTARAKPSPAEIFRAMRAEPVNSASDTLAEAKASTRNQQTGVAATSQRIGAENLAEMRQRDPTPIEILKTQQGGGASGGRVSELTDMIEGRTETGDVDLAQSRPDVPEQIAQQRSMTDQSISAALSRQRRNTSGTDLAQRMEQRLAEVNAKQGAYSTLSLAAVSPAGQTGIAMQLRM